jgi:predicted esterase YcpF (UPF0227 family)
MLTRVYKVNIEVLNKTRHLGGFYATQFTFQKNLKNVIIPLQIPLIFWV